MSDEIEFDVEILDLDSQVADLQDELASAHLEIQELEERCGNLEIELEELAARPNTTEQARIVAILNEETLLRPSRDLNFQRWLDGVRRKILEPGAL